MSLSIKAVVAFEPLTLKIIARDIKSILIELYPYNDEAIIIDERAVKYKSKTRRGLLISI
jgi:hypothetical protein